MLFWIMSRNDSQQNKKQHCHFAPTKKKKKRKHPSQTNQICWAQPGEQGRTHKWRSLYGLHYMGPPVFFDQQKFTFICMDTECHLENFPRAVADRDGWWEGSQRNLCCRYVLMMILILLEKYLENQKKSIVIDQE